MFKLQFKDHPSRSIWLVGEKVCLGTGAGNDVVLDGLGIKEQHAEILIEPHQLTLKSEAGSCFVNDLPVDSHYLLKANDELRMGKQRLLIVDPKQVETIQSPGKVVRRPEVVSPIATGWSLIPDHAKLKERDFSIGSRCVIGRSQNCDLTVPYKLLSREHALLSVKNGQLFLEDMESANGCFVNDQAVSQAVLKPGDKVAFAKLAFTVKGPDNTMKTASREALNKTMIRPAINIDDELQQAQQKRDDKEFNLSLEVEPSEGSVVSPSPSRPGSARWLVIAGLLIVVVASIIWGAPLMGLL